MLLLLAALGQAALLAGLDPRWLVPLDTPAAAPAGFDAVTAYVPLRDGRLTAVDLDRGRVRWTRDITTTLAPAAGESLVFVAGEGHVEAVSASDGRTRWRTPVPGRLLTITWDNHWLLCSNDSGDLAALRAADGELVWRVTLGAPLVTAPAAGLDRVYAGLEGGRVVSLALADGSRAWERTLPGRITGLRATDDQLVAGTTGRAIFSLDLATGRQRWRWRVGGDVTGAASSDGRLLFFAARDNVLRAVDARSGNLRWTMDLAARPLGEPQVVAGDVLVPLATSVAVFDAATGKSAASIPAGGELSAAPHLRGGRATGARLVTLTRDGKLGGYGSRIEEPPAPLGALPGERVSP